MTRKATHSLTRTNEKGVPFIGRCVLCGAEGLSATAVNEPCTNPHDVSEVDALVHLIENTSAVASN